MMPTYPGLCPLSWLRDFFRLAKELLRERYASARVAHKSHRFEHRFADMPGVCLVQATKLARINLFRGLRVAQMSPVGGHLPAGAAKVNLSSQFSPSSGLWFEVLQAFPFFWPGLLIISIAQAQK